MEYKLFKEKMYGWGFYYKSNLDKRFEKNNYIQFDFKNTEKWFYFLEILNNIFGNNYVVKNQYYYNIYYLDFINCYRAYRHFKRLPVNGQRTWTNAWTSYKCNTIINEWKINISKKIYGNVNSNILNSLFLAEHVNLLWKYQWKKEWLESRRKRVKYIYNNKGVFYIDIISMSKGYLSGFSKKKVMSKKKKDNSKKNYFTLGFSYKFTLYYLQPNNKLNLIDRNRVKILLSDEIIKNKNNKVKKKIDKKVIKKVKKSVWD